MDPIAALLSGLQGTSAMTPPGGGGHHMLPATTAIGAGPAGPGDVNPMHRALMGLGAGLMTARPGLSPGMAFAQGLGGSIMGGFGYDQQRQQAARQADEDRRRREQDEFQRRMGV